MRKKVVQYTAWHIHKRAVQYTRGQYTAWHIHKRTAHSMAHTQEGSTQHDTYTRGQHTAWYHSLRNKGTRL